MNEFLKFLCPLPSPKEIRLWDQKADEFGLNEFVLMENAARSALSLLINYNPVLKNKKILVFMGSGNNGGDAACLARNMIDYGAECHIISLKALDSYTGASKRHLELAVKNGVKFHSFEVIENTNSMEKNHTLLKVILSIMGTMPDIIIDGLLGTGFSGRLNQKMYDLINAINFLSQRFQSCFVMSLDIPSGLDPVSGNASPIAIKADVTASFAAIKEGEILSHARNWTGKLHVCNIGIPKTIMDKYAPARWLLDGKALSCIPSFESNTYKNYYGHVVVIGGKQGYSGAAHLAASAALSMGTGLVTAICPGSSAEKVKLDSPEIMILKAAEGEKDNWPDYIDDNLQAAINKADAVVIGPGFGREQDSMHFLNALLEISREKPMVLDADALIILARHPDWFSRITEKHVLTPHPGEAGALLGKTGKQIQEDRNGTLLELCKLTRATFVLKGANTLIGKQDGPIFVCPYDIFQLAIGGSGDVLSGCIGSFLGFHQFCKWQTLSLASLGVIFHTLAGLICAKKYPDRGLLASELVRTIPLVRTNFPHDTGDLNPWPL